MRKFKQLLLLACVVCMSWQVTAGQDINRGDFSAGIAASWGTGVKMVGLGAFAQYVPIQNVRGELAINYFFEGNWDTYFNVHYLLPQIGSGFYIYPLGGLCLANLDTDTEDPTEKRHRKFGFNLGAGGEFRLKSDVFFKLEWRKTIMPEIHQAVLTGGVGLTF